MRLFVAIPIDAACQRALETLVSRLRSPGDGLRWTAPAGWHITLQFLGSATPEQCACVQQRLATIRHSRFSIGLGVPTRFERAGAFVVEVQPSPELADLQLRVTMTTEPCGFATEDRPYKPHITLARSKGGRTALAALCKRLGGATKFAPLAAREFVLYESFLEPGGARYEARGRFDLS
jgi:RNA 2',3'-cyclic 3'-phosphodiesterase